MAPEKLTRESPVARSAAMMPMRFGAIVTAALTSTGTTAPFPQRNSSGFTERLPR